MACRRTPGIRARSGGRIRADYGLAPVSRTDGTATAAAHSLGPRTFTDKRSPVPTVDRPPDRRHAPRLDHVRVADAMHAGVVTCAADTPLRAVARMLVEHRIHCVAVPDIAGTGISTWAIVSDLDLVGAAAAGSVEGRTAGDIAAGEAPPSATTTCWMRRAAHERAPGRAPRRRRRRHRPPGRRPLHSRRGGPAGLARERLNHDRARPTFTPPTGPGASCLTALAVALGAVGFGVAHQLSPSIRSSRAASPRAPSTWPTLSSAPAS